MTLAPALIGAMTITTAFVVDVAHLYYVKSKLQQISDSAATGAAFSLPEASTVRTKALELVNLNKPSVFGSISTENDVRVGAWDKVNKRFTPSSENSTVPRTAVEVTTRRSKDAGYGNSVQTFFGKILGLSNVDVKATSVAVISGSDACIYVLDPSTNNAFEANGSSATRIDCGLIVNSTSSAAATQSGSSGVTTSVRACVTGNWSGGSWSPVPKTGSTACPPQADPLASVPEPTQPPPCPTPPEGSRTLPGNCTYTGRVRLSGNVTLSGLYYFKSAEFRIDSGTNISSTNLQIYLDNNSIIDFSNANDILLEGSNDPSKNGILIFAARQPNTQVLKLAGSGKLSLNGTLYTPTRALELTGNSAVASKTGYVIARRLKLSGSSVFTMNGFTVGKVVSGSLKKRTSLVQ